MKTINLREYYQQYQFDFLLEVTDEIAFCLQDFKRRERAYQMRCKRNKAFYSLDRNDGIDKDILFVASSSHEIYELNLTHRELYVVISCLSDKQAKRIYAHFFLGMTNSDIAKTEGVSEAAICMAIQCGLRNLKKYLKRLL
jgi:RNA polymerase sigma-70 factor, ECF subfamily